MKNLFSENNLEISPQWHALRHRYPPRCPNTASRKAFAPLCDDPHIHGIRYPTLSRPRKAWCSTPGRPILAKSVSMKGSGLERASRRGRKDSVDGFFTCDVQEQKVVVPTSGDGVGMYTWCGKWSSTTQPSRGLWGTTIKEGRRACNNFMRGTRSFCTRREETQHTTVYGTQNTCCTRALYQGFYPDPLRRPAET